MAVNRLKAELNPICHLLALLRNHHILHVSRIRVKGNDHNEFGSGSSGSYSEDREGFGLKVTCSLCVRKNRINIEREGAKSGQEQPQKMVSLSNLRLPAADIGTNVVVRVSELD